MGMSLQVPLPLKHTNHVDQWSSFEVYAWIAKNHQKFGLSQDDLDSIEESPLTGKQLMSKTDEDLSQEWAISIHAARKVVKKAASITKKAEKRKSEPLITSMLSNGDHTNNDLLYHHQDRINSTKHPLIHRLITYPKKNRVQNMDKHKHNHSHTIRIKQSCR